MTHPSGPAPIGTPPSRTDHRAREDTAAAGPIPGFFLPSSQLGASSLGHLPAHRRHAAPIREHQLGGTPIHAVLARPVHPTARPPPPGGRWTALLLAPNDPRRDTGVRSYVLAALRALHLDPT